jgi:hypothetical protein
MNLKPHVPVTATTAPVTATTAPVIATTHVPAIVITAMIELKLKLSICNEFRKNKTTSTSGTYIY